MSDRVNRDRLTPVVLALLAVVALSVSAATLDVVREGSVQGSDDAGVGGEGSAFDVGGTAPIDTSSANPAVVVLLRLLFGVVVVLGFIALLVRVYQAGWRSVIPVIVAALFCVLVVFALSSVLTPGSSQASQNGLLGGEQSSLPSGSPLTTGDGTLTVSDVPTVVDAPVVLFVVLVFAVVIGLFVLNRTTGDSPLDHRTDGSTTDPDRPETAAVGAAAGRAADSINADETLSNVIYNAWEEMTTHLDLSQETSTPGEFARAAVEAGMSREDVEELTRLFEATRYGDKAATETREQRAHTALRRIEREYATEESEETGER